MSSGAGGTRKHLRNATKCQRYRAAGRREANKRRKAQKRERHLAAARKRHERGKRATTAQLLSIMAHEHYP